MRVDELDVDPRISRALMDRGFVNLHPPQAEAIPIALTGKSLIAAIPTASGKSLIGYVPALKTVLEKGMKVLYIVPLKALASEKKDDFDAFSSLGIKAHLSSGDLDAEDRGIDDANVVVATSEKADSMLRHRSRWVEGVGLVIADEVHMIHDPGRGPTLEVTLTKLMRRNRHLQVIALSATVSNAEDLARWLHADLVRSDWRPIELREGVSLAGTIRFSDGTSRDVPSEVPKEDEVWPLVKQAVKDGGQCLVFVNTRRSTESLAVKYSEHMGKMARRTLTKRERDVVEGGADATFTGRRLAECISCGMAFHNAGLSPRQRRFVEDEFKAGRIKCIVATPTLAAGINLPARRVVIRDTNRFEVNAGNVPISVMEVKQMSGRAGRPGYDPYGEAVLVAKTLEDADHLMYDYIMHGTEKLSSKLFDERTLRGHLLGLISTGDAESEEEIVEFLKETFFGTTSQMFGIESVVNRMVTSLAEDDMVERGEGTVTARPFGKRVSDLCIDPASASILRTAVESIADGTDPLQVLLAAAMTPDVRGMYPRKSDEDLLQAKADELWEDLLVIPEDLDGYEYGYFLSDLKVALLISEWMDEVPEERITDEWGVGPGDIRARVDMMDWIVYSMIEIAYIFNPDAVRSIRPLTTRIRYGVKAELIELVSLRGVGRSRARILFNNGIRSKSDICMADEAVLAKIEGIGPALAAKLKEQTGSGMPEPAPSMSPSEEEAMLLEMAAEYGEAQEAPSELVARPEEEQTAKPKASSRKAPKKAKEEKTGQRQSSLFDF